MNQIIHKQTLSLVDKQTVFLPVDSAVVHVGVQNGKITIWYEFEVPPSSNDEVTLVGSIPYQFRIVGTGQLMENADDWFYLDTVFIDGFVWHVYLLGDGDE